MPKFTPRQRKQKHRHKEPTAPVDTNVTELAPVSKDEKEARRQKLREELRDQHTNVSAKKQKRLDKYIVRGRVRSFMRRCLMCSAGKQTQERREPRAPEETCSSKSRHFLPSQFKGSWKTQVAR